MSREMCNKISDALIICEYVPVSAIKDIKDLLTKSDGDAVLFEDLLLDNNIVSAGVFRKVKTMVTNIEIVDVLNTEFDADLLKLITREQAVRY